MALLSRDVYKQGYRFVYRPVYRPFGSVHLAGGVALLKAFKLLRSLQVRLIHGREGASIGMPRT